MVYSVSKEKAWICINNISVFIFFFFFFLQVYTGSSLFFAANMFVIPLYLVQKIKFSRDIRFQCLTLMGMYTLFLLTNIRNQNVFAGCFLNLQYIFVTLLICQKRISHRIFLISLVIQILLLGPKIISGINPNMLLQGGSRNVVSALAINQTLLYYGHVYKYEKKIWLWPAIINLFFCLICIGRSGIIVSAGIFILVFFYWFSQKTNRVRILVIIGLCIVIVFLRDKIITAVTTIGFNHNSMNFFENFQQTGLKSGSRDFIKSEYMSIIDSDIVSFFLGIKNIEMNPVFAMFDGNLHNSFLTLHTYYSLFGFLLVVVLSFFSFLATIKIANLFPFGLLCCAYLRVSKDILAFPGFIDVFIFFEIFYCCSYIKNFKYFKKSY